MYKKAWEELPLKLLYDLFPHVVEEFERKLSMKQYEEYRNDEDAKRKLFLDILNTKMNWDLLKMQQEQIQQNKKKRLHNICK